jgi:hypothetical protein
MNKRVACDEHGEDLATYVCVHVLDSLQDKKPRGFLWSLDDDDDYSAICQECNDMSDEEWEQKSSDLLRVLCLGCFKKAAELNGVRISADGATLQ